MSPERPAFRRLRVFAVDPGLAAQLDTVAINEVVLRVPWETDLAGRDILAPGPVGEYVAVVDEDERGRRLHQPVDLDDPALLSRCGLQPSDGNPQFRQQMVYAVAMRTIGTFERALGRRAHWRQAGPGYQRQIRLYPHYQNIENAFYDPTTLAACFGYFQAAAGSPTPGMAVFTCLSQDVVAHVLTHALLDGMHLQFTDDVNPDVAAFHEAFADLVALLQRLVSQPELLKHQLAQTRGDLAGCSQLGIVAQQFGQSLGMSSGIRSAFGSFDAQGVWRTRAPDPKAYRTTTEPHARGALLLAAVFDALRQIYQARVADLLRMASEGTGRLPEGDLHPDLVNRLAAEATKSADHVLDMCVRALDYCPSVDITFGDYLRAIVTADTDLEPADVHNYRVAFVQAFRRHGLVPADVGTTSIDTLLWPRSDPGSPEAAVVQEFIRGLARDYTSWNLPRDRERLYDLMQGRARDLEKDLAARGASARGLLGGIDPRKPFRVHAIWPRERVGPDGEPLSQWLIEIGQETRERGKRGPRLAGCALLADAETGLTRYIIHKTARAGRRTASLRASLERWSRVTATPPRDRPLRVFTFDPSAGTQLETARINQVTLSVPWEPLDRGPRGEYLEVIDRDPPSRCFYEGVDLDNRYLLAEDGYPPSQSTPQFHQQMVYAVAMRTIRNFERALGRLALWAPHRQPPPPEGGRFSEGFVRRLRLYPHALREANAFYSPEKQAVLFGYFQATLGPGSSPVSVFTCLSHDVIAHEVTHALLDGMHRRFAEPSNPDVLAFHEAFADLVALFQHFSLPEVLRHQIAATRGDLASQNRLGELAQEVGLATGHHGALRSAIGEYDAQTGQWRPRAPDPDAYRRETEPHARGALLVATVFDAFLTLYRARVADLFRIATRGTGVLPAGQLHPDLVSRLAAEAAKTAQRVLEMCIRALDYCPPVDITFGDYLRALITADSEFDPLDEDNSRAAFIEAFRRHGILPDDVRALSEEGLLWKQATALADEDTAPVIEFIRGWTTQIDSWNLSRNRERLFARMRDQRIGLHAFLEQHGLARAIRAVDPAHPFEVHSLRPSSRVDWQGKSHFQWIIELTQRTPEFLDPVRAALPGAEPDYYFRGGVTLLVDAETGRVRYGVYKRLDSQERRRRQRRYMTEVANATLHATYFGAREGSEPFAALHRF